MAEEKKIQEDVQFPLNKRLLEEAAKIKEERKTAKERISKIDQSRGSVSQSVYERVRSDYLKKLNENTDALLEKKQDIDRELSALYEAKKKVESNVKIHREQLEEINFRQNLGEYKEDEYHKLADEENEKLGKFEKILAAIETNIKEYESLFEGQEDILPEGEEIPEAPLPPPPPSGEKTDEGIIVPEDEYQVGEEGYFAADTGEVQLETQPGIGPATEETGREVTPIEAAEETYPKITIEEGYGKGDVFEMSKDQFMIGRAGGNDIVLKEAKVSRQHASIKRHGKEYLIEDLHSSNGVFVNDEKITEHALSDGDKISIGDFVLRFSMNK